MLCCVVLCVVLLYYCVVCWHDVERGSREGGVRSWTQGSVWKTNKAMRSLNEQTRHETQEEIENHNDH